jgi:hypothetical protein
MGRVRWLRDGACDDRHALVRAPRSRPKAVYQASSEHAAVWSAIAEPTYEDACGNLWAADKSFEFRNAGLKQRQRPVTMTSLEHVCKPPMTFSQPLIKLKATTLLIINCIYTFYS